jgi:hypothetical protein
MIVVPLVTGNANLASVQPLSAKNAILRATLWVSPLFVPVQTVSSKSAPNVSLATRTVPHVQIPQISTVQFAIQPVINSVVVSV